MGRREREGKERWRKGRKNGRKEGEKRKERHALFILKCVLLLVIYLTVIYNSSVGKESTWNAEDPSSIPGLGRTPGEGIGYPLQYSSLENSTDCIVHGVAKSQKPLSDFHRKKTLTSSLWVIN